MKFTAHEFVKMVTGLIADAHAVSTINGAGIDCQGFRELLAHVHLDDKGAAGVFDFKLQESKDNGVADAYSDITGAAITQLSANGSAVIRLDLEKRERWIRCVATVAGNAVDAAASVALLHNRDLPVTQSVGESVSVG